MATEAKAEESKRDPKDFLNPKQIRFAQEYTHDYNATRAYMRAGYSPKGAKSSASELLANPNVQALIAQIEEERTERSEMSNIRLMQELERQILWDARKLYDDENNAIPLAALDDETAAGVTSVEIIETFSGPAKNKVLEGYTKKVKGPNKLAAIELLAKMRGLLIDRKDITSGGEQIKTIVTISLPQNDRNVKPESNEK